MEQTQNLIIYGLFSWNLIFLTMYKIDAFDYGYGNCDFVILKNFMLTLLEIAGLFGR